MSWWPYSARLRRIETKLDLVIRHLGKLDNSIDDVEERLKIVTQMLFDEIKIPESTEKLKTSADTLEKAIADNPQ